VQLLQLGHVTPKVVNCSAPASNQNQSVCYAALAPVIRREKKRRGIYASITT
jgi:hypothetical protein